MMDEIERQVRMGFGLDIPGTEVEKKVEKKVEGDKKS